MQTRTVNIFFIVAFMLFLLVPLFCMNFAGGGVSQEENRVLAARPPVSELAQKPAKFVADFDAWFADNVGFRENFISLYNQLDKIETQGQYQQGIYTYLIGLEGHHYFAGVDAVLTKKYQGTAVLSDETLSKLAAKLEEVNAYLAERDIPFIMMICTDKETIYPEYYPKTIIRGPEPIQLEVVTTYLQEHTSADVFNIREALLAQKENYMIYGKDAGDLSHYNQIGAFFAYQELMRHTRTYFPEMATLSMEDLSISNDERNVPAVSLKDGYSYTQLDDSFFDAMELERPYVGENQAFQNEGASLPTLLMIGDSFGWQPGFLTTYLPQHFGTTIFLHFKNIARFQQYLDAYQPDIVIFEAAERGLSYFATSALSMPPLSAEGEDTTQAQ